MTMANSWNSQFNSAKGSLLIGNGTEPAALSVGSNGTALIADSSQPQGMGWSAAFNSIPWTVESSASFSAAPNNGYYCDTSANAVEAILPNAPSNGTLCEFFVGSSAHELDAVAQGSDAIQVGTVTSTAGGLASNSTTGSSLVLVYISSKTLWIAVPYIGTWSVI